MAFLPSYGYRLARHFPATCSTRRCVAWSGATPVRSPGRRHFSAHPRLWFASARPGWPAAVSGTPRHVRCSLSAGPAMVLASGFCHGVTRRRHRAPRPVWAQIPTLHSTMHLYPINGATHRVGPQDTAFSYRDATWAQVIVGVDPDPTNNARIIAWTKDYWEALPLLLRGELQRRVARCREIEPARVRPAGAHSCGHRVGHAPRGSQGAPARSDTGVSASSWTQRCNHSMTGYSAVC